MSENQIEIQEERIRIEQLLKDYLASLDAKEKRAHVAWVVVGVLILLLVIGIFVRKPLKDYTIVDERVAQRDSLIAIKEKDITLINTERNYLRVQSENLKKENAALKEQYISNLEKHTAINRKRNETNPTVIGISKDSLRRLFSERN